MVYVDLDMFSATKIYKLPDDMSTLRGTLSEPLACCIRALNRAVSADGFRFGDTVVIQGAGPIAATEAASRMRCVKATIVPNESLQG